MNDPDAALRALLERNDASGCAFLAIGRESLPAPRNLFGSRSPALTARS